MTKPLIHKVTKVVADDEENVPLLVMSWKISRYWVRKWVRQQGAVEQTHVKHWRWKDSNDDGTIDKTTNVLPVNRYFISEMNNFDISYC